MRLHRIALRDVRGVTHADVDLGEHGVTVIEGPNEIGKSTLVEAVDLVLRVKASSRSAAVRALQPVGRDVGPSIEIELTLGGQRLRYRKQFLRAVVTELIPVTPVGPARTGDEAHRYVEALLGAHLDRPLWEALRFLQSGGAADAARLDLTASTAFRSALDAAAGQQADSGSEGQELLARLDVEFQRYFTARGAPRGQLAAADTVAREAASAHERAVRAVLAQEAAAAEVARLRPRVGDLEQRIVAAAQRLDAATARGVEVDRATSALEVALAQRGSAESRLAGARAASVERERLVTRLADDRAVLEAARIEQEAAGQAQEQVTARLSEAEQAHGELTERAVRDREGAEHAAAELQAARETREHRQLLTAVAAHDRDVQALAETRAAVREHVVDAGRLRDLERSADRLLRALAALDAGAAHLQVEPEPGSEVEVLVDDEPWRDAAWDDPRLLTRETVVRVPGAARIRISPATDSIALAQEAERAGAEHAALLSAAVVPDLDTARHVAAERAGLEREARRLQAQVDADSTQQRRRLQRLERLERARPELSGEHAAGPVAPAAVGPAEPGDAAGPGLSPAAPDVAPPVRRDSSAADACEEVVERAEQAWESARVRAGASADEVRESERAVEQLRTVAAAAERRLDRSQQSVDSLERALTQADEQLTLAREQATDVVLAEAVAGAEQELHRATDRETETRAHVAALDLEALERDAALARADLERLQEQRRAAGEALGRALGLLEAQGEADLDAALRAAHAAARDAVEDLAAVQRAARAARLLRETVRRHRDRARERYAAPFADRLRALGREVYGQSFDVDVDESLVVDTRTLHGDTVPVEQLSAGAREQLGVLVRLAVAGLVDPAHGVPVVIDDALGFTDPGRLRSMARVLSGIRGSHQVLLLTCDPDRHAGIDGAHRVRLGARLHSVSGRVAVGG